MAHNSGLSGHGKAVSLWKGRGAQRGEGGRLLFDFHTSVTQEPGRIVSLSLKLTLSLWGMWVALYLEKQTLF